MKSLSKTANEAFVWGLQTAPATGEQLQECDEVEEQSNGDDDDHHDIPEVGEVTAHQVVLELTRTLFITQINQLTDSNATSCAPVVNVHRTGNQRHQTTENERPIHSNVCNHRRQGHERQTSSTGEVIIIVFIAQIMSAVEVEEGLVVHVSVVNKPLIDLPVVVHQNQ